MPLHRMAVPELPGRRSRLVTLEQEVARSLRRDWLAQCWTPPCSGCSCTPDNACTRSGVGDIIARALYTGGFSSSERMQGYHSGGNVRDAERFARVEHDGSVGAEVIHSFLDLSDDRACERFCGALDVVGGIAKADRTCGGHVHVDGSGLTLADVNGLYQVFCYLEDVLYRIGSCQPRGAHRTGAPHHSPYAPVIPKGLSGLGVPSRMGQERGALNLANFVNSLDACGCNAQRYGAPDLCTCQNIQRTIEFRLWDGTTDHRRIHAHLALSVALVEYARGRRIDPRRLPALEYDRAQAVEVSRRGKVIRRLAFIMEKLPLTDAERSDIAYCIESSGSESMRDILAVVGVNARDHNAWADVETNPLYRPPFIPRPLGPQATNVRPGNRLGPLYQAGDTVLGIVLAYDVDIPEVEAAIVALVSGDEDPMVDILRPLFNLGAVIHGSGAAWMLQTAQDCSLTNTVQREYRAYIDQHAQRVGYTLAYRDTTTTAYAADVRYHAEMRNMRRPLPFQSWNQRRLRANAISPF